MARYAGICSKPRLRKVNGLRSHLFHSLWLSRTKNNFPQGPTLKGKIRQLDLSVIYFSRGSSNFFSSSLICHRRRSCLQSLQILLSYFMLTRRRRFSLIQKVVIFFDDCLFRNCSQRLKD